jgi:hypothetical protein
VGLNIEDFLYVGQRRKEAKISEIQLYLLKYLLFFDLK